MYMLNMVIILIVMYCNVVTAIDKIPTYLLRFNRRPSCEHCPARNASPSSVSRVSPSQRLPTPRHSTHQPPRQSLFLTSFFTLSWLHLCEPFIYGKRFSKSQPGIVLVVCNWPSSTPSPNITCIITWHKRKLNKSTTYYLTNYVTCHVTTRS